MSNGRRASWAHSPETFLLAAGVGVIGGAVGTLFQLGSRGLQRLFIGPGNMLTAAAALPWYKALLIPFLGAVVAAVLDYGLSRKRRTQGMADVMEAVSFRRARDLSIRATVSRALSSLALISTGGSVGREGPIAYMSASFGTRLARMASVPQSRLGLFAGCGIASGMAASYFAPFGAALFAMEVVLGNFSLDILAPVIVSSVVSSLVIRGLAADALLGDWISGPPLYHLPRFQTLHAGEYLIYVALGVVAALGAWLFIKTLRETGRLFRRIPISPMLRLPLGGLILGCIGIWLPHVWGNGNEAVNLIMNVEKTPALGFVALLFVMKIVATSVTLGSGGSGGMFTPTMFVGASLGLLLGTGTHSILPGLVVDPRHYAVVGMAATLAATIHAPITAIFLLFELTRETEMVLPTMVAVITATVTVRSLGLDSVYMDALKRRGLDVPEGIEETALTTTRIDDIMRRETVSVVATAGFDEIVQAVQKTRTNSIYVVDEGGILLGAIRLHDIKNHLADAHLGPAVIAVDLFVRVASAEPDQTVAEVLDAFDDPDLHELPVVNGEGVLQGLVDRRDLISVLSLEVLRGGGRRAKFVEYEGAQHYVEIPKGQGVGRIDMPEELAGEAVRDTDFRGRTGLTILTIVRSTNGAEKRIEARPGTVLEKGDALIVMGPVEAIQALGGEV